MNGCRLSLLCSSPSLPYLSIPSLPASALSFFKRQACMYSRWQSRYILNLDVPAQAYAEHSFICWSGHSQTHFDCRSVTDEHTSSRIYKVTSRR